MEKVKEKVNSKDIQNNLMNSLKNRVNMINIIAFSMDETVFQKQIMMQHLCI